MSSQNNRKHRINDVKTTNESKNAALCSLSNKYTVKEDITIILSVVF